MSAPRYDEAKLKSAEHLLGYFDQLVLASYLTEPHKYTVESDYFEGELNVTAEYYRELEASGKTDESLSVRFGFRTLWDGNTAIVAWLPDLLKRSDSHVQKWGAFRLRSPEWTTDHDERFEKWVQRYLEGNLDVDNGPLHHLGQTMRVINSLTMESVGGPLYKQDIPEKVPYPSADNTHRYQDSHKELYRYLIDGLNKQCISDLGSKLGKAVNVSDKKTILALTNVFPGLKASSCFMPAADLISEQRRLATHGMRPAAERFPAFSQFTKDLFLCLKAIKELLTMLEEALGLEGDDVHNRLNAKKLLPEIAPPANTSYSINEARLMKGRTVEKVEFGFRKKIEGVHESEALIIYFTDGSVMGLDTGSNAANLAADETGPRPEDFHVDFIVHWVPALPKGMSTHAR